MQHLRVAKIIVLERARDDWVKSIYYFKTAL